MITNFRQKNKVHQYFSNFSRNLTVELPNEKDHKPLDVAPGTGWSVTLKHPQKIDLSTAVMLRLDENMQL